MSILGSYVEFHWVIDNVAILTLKMIQVLSKWPETDFIWFQLGEIFNMVISNLLTCNHNTPVQRFKQSFG